MRHVVLYGPWSMFFTALLLISLLTGCRQPAPPAPPTTAWIRLEGLTPLHPSQRMLTDLDQRLTALAAQRARLRTRATPDTPDRLYQQNTPPLDGLHQPPPQVALAPPPATITQRSLNDLRHDETQRWQRDLLRQQRTLTERAAARVQQQLARLDDDAETRQHALAVQYRTRLVNAEAQYQIAEKQLVEAQAFLTKNPDSENGKRLATRGERDTAARKNQWEKLKGDFDSDWQKIAKEVAEQKDAALAEHQRALRDELQRLQQQLRTAAETRATAAHQRAAAGALPETPPDLPVDVTFPAAPGGAVRLDAKDLQQAAKTAIREHAHDQQATLHAIDLTIAELTQERRALRDTILRDTQDAARAVAAQHGYHLAFTPTRGKQLTSEVRGWLQEYWSAAGDAHR